MNYEKIYSMIIESRKTRETTPAEYYERHHIWPKSLGGPDEKWNIVHLTAREHFIAHWLLYKITDGQDKIKMAYALNSMCCLINNTIRKYNSYDYEIARKSNSFAAKSRIGELNPFYNKKHSDDVKNHLSEINKKSFEERHGYEKSIEIKTKISDSLKGKSSWNKNKTYEEIYGDRSNEVKQKILKGAKKRRKTVLITKPNGEKEITHYLKEFCENETLKTGIRINYVNMKSVANGNQSHHKNYLAEYI